MAGNGLSLIEGINELVETVGEFPTSSNPPESDTSIYGRARDILVRESKRVMSLGWPENTLPAQSTTAVVSSGDAANFYMVLGSDVLQIRGAGSSSHRDLVMRIDSKDGNDATADTPKVFDANKGTFNFGSAESVFIDKVVDISFENVSPPVQDVILGRARMVFQRRIQGNMEADATLLQEYQEADINAPRNQPQITQRFNTRPVTASARPGGQQKEG